MISCNNGELTLYRWTDKCFAPLSTKKECGDVEEVFAVSGEGGVGGKVVEDGMRSDGETSECVTDDDMTSAEVRQIAWWALFRV